MLSIHAKHGMKGYQWNYCNNDLVGIDRWILDRHLLLTLLNCYYNNFRYFKERVWREELNYGKQKKEKEGKIDG